jgi:hypothetical protein
MAPGHLAFGCDLIATRLSEIKANSDRQSNPVVTQFELEAKGGLNYRRRGTSCLSVQQPPTPQQ